MNFKTPSPDVVAAFREPETGSGKVIGKTEAGNVVAVDPVPFGKSSLGWLADGRMFLLIPSASGEFAVALTQIEARALSAGLLKGADGAGREVVPQLGALVAGEV